MRVASVRPPDRPYEQLSAEEQEEQRGTFYIQSVGWRGALVASARMLLRRPASILLAFGYTLRLAHWRPRLALRNLLYFAEAVVFADWMRREKLSRAHMHFTTTVGLLARQIVPMRTSATIHGSAEFLDPRGFYLREKVEEFDLVCAISDYGRSQLESVSQKKQWNKIRVARLGVDTSVFRPRPFRYNPSPVEILCVGRLARGKGQDILISALERLRQQGHNARLRLVGDGPERAALERLAAVRDLASQVVFEGWLNADRVHDCYQQADVFALASEAEGIPVVLMEAMAMEIPCVATKVMGIPELIRHRVDGLLVDNLGREAFAEALDRLLSEPELRLRLGKAARERVLGEYDLDRNAATLAGILREI